MTALNSPRSRLSFDEANAVCREFLPIGGAIFEYMEALEDAGFSAFVPYYEFIRSFCSSNADLETHKRCLIEGAKYLVGRPFPFPITDQNRGRLFFSPFLDELTQRRDKENGVPASELVDRYPGEVWRLQIDPCQRQSIFESVNDRQHFEKRWSNTLQEQRRRLTLEAVKHASNLSKTYKFDDQSQRYDFFTTVVRDKLSQLGFELDARKARVHHPVFSKQVSADWDICWTLEEPRTFYSNAVEGNLRPYLQIRHRRLSGSIEKAKSGEYLIIRYDKIVPGFFNAYGHFFRFEELETMIKAHLYLYGLMAPIIEGGLKRVFDAREADTVID